jgi:hypothetical protein
VDCQARETVAAQRRAQQAVHSLSTITVLIHSKSQRCTQLCPQTQLRTIIQ